MHFPMAATSTTAHPAARRAMGGAGAAAVHQQRGRFVEEMHVDGLRVDLTQALHRDNTLNADGAGRAAAPTCSGRSCSARVEPHAAHDPAERDADRRRSHGLGRGHEIAGPAAWASTAPGTPPSTTI